MPIATADSDPSWFGFLLIIKDGLLFSRNDLVRYLESKKIQTRNLFAGNLICHPCFASLARGRDYRVVGSLQNTDKLMNDSFWLGVYPGLRSEQIEYIIDEIGRFLVGRS